MILLFSIIVLTALEYIYLRELMWMDEEGLLNPVEEDLLLDDTLIANGTDIVNILVTNSTRILDAMLESYVSNSTSFLDDDSLRFLKPKPKSGGGAGGGSSVVILGDDGLPLELESEYPHKQNIRILYVIGILTSFFKVLNVAQIYNSVGYLVKMLSGIGGKAISFLAFFMYLNGTFAFVMHAIGIRFDETLIKDFNGEFTGFEWW